jgi:two-component system, OmpR family, response regulator
MNRRKLLLVDDESDIRRVAHLCLHHIGGWEVHEAASGAEALAAVEEMRPDMVLLDVMMPEMDGPATLLRLRELSRMEGVPIVFLTAKALASDHARLRTLGACGVLTKPFDPLLLPGLVDAILEGRR